MCGLALLPAVVEEVMFGVAFGSSLLVFNFYCIYLDSITLAYAPQSLSSLLKFVIL